MVKILIVDDEPDIEPLFTQNFRKKIRDKEWFFLFCQNGKEALQALKKHPEIDLVLSDINMPIMDGLTFLEEIKKNNISAQTVIISAYGDMKNIRTAMNRGAFDFITKPMNFDDVLNTIQKTIQYVNKQKKALEDQNKLLSFQKELDIAKSIQESILPPPVSPNPQCHMTAQVIPAKEVGGDFYDFFSINKDLIGFSIADVSGKGISSAVFAVVHQTFLKSISATITSPKKCIETINQVFSKNNENCMFVTLFYGVLNMKNGSLTYVNAGHNSPFKISSNQTVETLPCSGNPPLDTDPNAVFHENTINFQPGETLFLYTDGITEARNNKKEFFGEHRLKELLSKNASSSIEQIGEKVLNSVWNFIGQETQSDDITYLLCQYKS